MPGLREDDVIGVSTRPWRTVLACLPGQVLQVLGYGRTSSESSTPGAASLAVSVSLGTGWSAVRLLPSAGIPR